MRRHPRYMAPEADWRAAHGVGDAPPLHQPIAQNIGPGGLTIVFGSEFGQQNGSVFDVYGNAMPCVRSS